jgi:hypothetical protein
LLEHPEWINQSPYKLGWIVKIKPSSNMVMEEELKSLMTNEQYNKFIGEMGGGEEEEQEEEEKGVQEDRKRTGRC